jgi:LPS sulfotransferase NodH
MAQSAPKMPSNERHRWQFEFDRREPVRSYVICSMQRSGTELLSHMLAGTMLAGVPHEYLRQDLMARLKESWGIELETLDDYLRELTLRKTSPNGVFGLKALWNQYLMAVGEDRDPTELLPNASFVHLRREDRVRQAVSWTKALKTGSWLSVIPEERAEPEFDRAQIERIVRRIEEGEAGWERVFERYGITPFRLTYEELATDPAAKAREVLEFTGVELPADFDVQQPVLKRQADTLSDEWVARYASSAGS